MNTHPLRVQPVAITYARMLYVSYSAAGPHATDQTLHLTCDVKRTPPPAPHGYYTGPHHPKPGPLHKVSRRRTTFPNAFKGAVSCFCRIKLL